MNEGKRQARSVPDSWDRYWIAGSGHGAYTCEGAGHPAIQSFWRDIFRGARENFGAPRVIDIASGNGAVLEHVLSVSADQLPDVTCLDISVSAIRGIQAQYPQVRTVVADARRMPLESGSYDIVTSQYGIEYAGVDAIAEGARLVAPGGQLALLIHNRAGSIYQDCAANLDAVGKIRQSEFIALALDMFKAGFAAINGASRVGYETAAGRLQPAVHALESVMAQHGKHVAGEMVSRLYDDVGTIHEQLQRYEPSQVLNWLERMHVEIENFGDRMASMCDAAIDVTTFRNVCDQLREQSFVISRADALVDEDRQLPLAWALVAERH